MQDSAVLALGDLLRAEASLRRRIAPGPGASSTGWSILVLLHQAGGSLEQSTLLDALGTSKANLSEVLSTLERQGLIARRPLAEDRRRTRVVLAQAGRKQVSRELPRHNERVEAAFASLDEPERRRLAELCRKLCA